MSKITRLTLKNFTAFESLDHEFSPGVNVLIGKNGTGKTHLLKTLYAACAITVGEDLDKSFGLKLRNVFNPYQGRVGRLVRRKKGGATAKIVVIRKGNQKLSAQFSNQTESPEDINIVNEKNWKTKEQGLVSAYIPVKEMLAHASGFVATTSKREIAFEEVYVDIIKCAFLPRLRGAIDRDRHKLLDALENAIEGKVDRKGEYFFLKNKQGDLEFTLLAEGMRKLALIWLLIQNGTLLKGSILFWDEPEANLNPSLMGQVVDVILELQRLEVQVFLTTHNYVLLKEFDLRKKTKDSVHYISLYREESGPVQAKSSETYEGINPNAILETFDVLYEEEIAKSLRGKKT